MDRNEDALLAYLKRRVEGLSHGLSLSKSCKVICTASLGILSQYFTQPLRIGYDNANRLFSRRIRIDSDGYFDNQNGSVKQIVRVYMQTNRDFNQKILDAIHSWEASHDDRQPPTWLLMNTVHQQEFDTATYEYNGRAIPIIYSDNVSESEIRFGKGQLPR